MEATDAASMRGVAQYAIPARSSVANAPEMVDAYPWLAASRETMARGATALPAVASFSRMSTALQPVLARGLADRRPAKEVLAEMDQAVRRLLDEQRGQERRP